MNNYNKAVCLCISMASFILGLFALIGIIDCEESFYIILLPVIIILQEIIIMGIVATLFERKGKRYEKNNKK